MSIWYREALRFRHFHLPQLVQSVLGRNPSVSRSQSLVTNCTWHKDWDKAPVFPNSSVLHPDFRAPLVPITKRAQGGLVSCTIPSEPLPVNDFVGQTTNLGKRRWHSNRPPVQPRPAIAFWFNLALKATLVAFLALGAYSGLQLFEVETFPWRLVTYPVAALMVPAAWVALSRRTEYPFAIDFFLTVPVLIDTVGSAMDLYVTVQWWDDAIHFVSWALLSGAVGALAWRNRTGPWQAFALVVGFGAVTAILWEIAQYLSFKRNSLELGSAYTDTLGDLFFGLIGSFLAGLAVYLLYRFARSRSVKDRHFTTG